MRYFIVVALLMAVFAPHPANAISGAKERKFLMGSFDNIVIDGDMQVNIITGKSPSAMASGDVRMLDALQIRRIGTTMTIRMQDLLNNEKGRPISQPLIVTLTNRHVRDITLRGNATLTVNEINEPTDSTILLNGGGKIAVAKLTVDKLLVTLFGNGQLVIGSGKANSGKVDIRGGAIFDAAGLNLEKLILSHNGNATSTATVSDKTEITNDGSGSIKIGGKGLCFIRKAGMAAIDCKEGNN